VGAVYQGQSKFPNRVSHQLEGLCACRLERNGEAATSASRNHSHEIFSRLAIGK
jgi:hypothetical protein